MSSAGSVGSDFKPFKDVDFTKCILKTPTVLKKGEKLIGDNSSGFDTQSEHTVSESEDFDVGKKVKKEKVNSAMADAATTLTKIKNNKH